MPHRPLQFGPKLGLPAILLVYLVMAGTQTSASWFGYYHDDSLYWSAAQSLAGGHGYRMASVPGEPRQTKYPVAFPWLLSLVWRLDPQFPANLEVALWIVRLSGVAFLAAAFVLLRQLGFEPLSSLAMTAVCALHPIFLHLSGLLLSDVPFMAVAVWSLVSAQRALKGQVGSRTRLWWVAALGLAALATLLRAIGVALPAGIALAALWRRQWAPAAASAALCLTVVAAAVFAAGSSQPLVVSTDGYGQTIQFYKSYVAFWKLSTPNWQTFAALLTFNFRELVKEPAVMAFNLPASGFTGFGWQLAAVALSFTVVRGLFRLPERRHPALLVLAVYAAAVLVWNYTLMDRFFVWALPLFLAGAWREIACMAASTRQLFRIKAAVLDRAVAVAVMAVFAALGVFSGIQYLTAMPSTLAEGLRERSRMQSEKTRAYDWIRENTASGDVFVADEDASLYLYTGRQALRPMAFSTAAFYLQSQEALDHDLARMSDVACHLGARYWLAANDDYHLESAQEWIQKRSDELLAGRPEVFKSPSGEVRIYELSGLTGAGGPCARPPGAAVEAQARGDRS